MWHVMTGYISKGTQMALNYSDHDNINKVKNIPVITSSFLACGSQISSASR
jgi:hypothetical protein